MSETIQRASNILLAPGNIEIKDLTRFFDVLLSQNIDEADLYFQSIRGESWFLEESIVKEGSFHLDSGVGVRAITGEKTGFAYSNEIALPALTQAVNAVKSIANQGQDKHIQVWNNIDKLCLYDALNPLESMTKEEKVFFLKSLDAYARSIDPRVQKVSISLSGSYETVIVAGSDGTLSADFRPLIRLNISVIVEQNGRLEKGYCGGGKRTGYQYFVIDDLGKKYVDKAVQQALINLDAIPTPAGVMPVILSSGWCGVLLHEAVGHGLEGDFNRKGSSSYAGKIGEKVASRHCTIVDNGTIEGVRGSMNIDDEGVQSQDTILIENGILKGYMQDKHNAKLMGVSSTGNGRRESYAYQPMPRMTSTYMLPSDYELDEMIDSIDKGIYVKSMEGGQVDITSGEFVFSASEAYLIENGKIKSPLKGATLIGNGPDIMNKVSMVGKDFELDQGVGTCGKNGQTVPVNVGQPSLKIDNITVGGTG